MSNKVQKTLTAALTATIATGAIAVPAMAAGKEGNVDDLYKAAFEAAVKTQDLEKVTQADINAAREAINALRGTAVESAVPTFSSIVDKAQQQFLTIAYNSIVECQKTETQKDINTARTNIKDLPAEFKNAYSTAIDTVQQKKIDATDAAVKKAEKSQKAEDIKAAQALLDDLKTVVDNEGVKEWAVKTETSFKEATAKFTIVAAEALNNNSVKVVFNKAIDAKTATVENFSVTPKNEAYNNLYVGSVEVSEDGTTATLTLLNDLADKGEYVVSASKLKDKDGKEMAEKATAEFKYEVAAVKSVEFTTTNIPVSADLKNYVIVKDAKGRNVTDEYKNKLTFTTSNAALVNDDGIAQKPADANENTVMVGVSVDGTEISTSALLTISESAATSFEGFAIIKNECEINGKTFSQLSNEDKLSYVTAGQTDAKLVVGFKNQFGKELSLDKSEFKVETNYNPTVAIVEVDDNGIAHINALSEGTAYVKVKCGTIERTVAIQVKSAALPGAITTKENNFNLVATNEKGIKVDYTVNNQYGAKYTGNADVTVQGGKGDQYVTTTIKDSNGSIINDKSALIVEDAKDNQINIKPAAGVKTGTYTVTLTTKFDYKGNTTTLTKDITVNVVNGGSLTGYKVQINNTNLDVNADNENKTSNTAIVTVYEVDAQGNELGLAKNSKIEVLNSNGNEAKADEINLDKATNTITALKDGVYTVKVMVGTYTVKQITINVVDTNAKASVVVLNAQSATVDSEKTIKDVLTTIGYSVRDQFGKEIKGATIETVKCTVANQSGVDVKNQTINWTGINVNGAAVNKGSFDLVINSVTVTGGKTIYFNTPLFVQVTVNESEANKAKVIEDAKQKAEAKQKEEAIKKFDEKVKENKKAEDAKMKKEVKKLVLNNNTNGFTDRIVYSQENQKNIDNVLQNAIAFGDIKIDGVDAKNVKPGDVRVVETIPVMGKDGKALDKIIKISIAGKEYTIK